MSSHFAQLKEELDAMHHELQEQQATVESIEKLTQELEAQKQALVAKSTEINNQQDEMKAMQSRLNALTTIDSAIDAAMHSKSSAEDVIKHVIEKAMRSEHMTGCEIVQTVFKTVFRVNGRSRGHGIDDFFIDLVNDDDNMRLAIEAALKKSANVKVVDHAVLAAGHGANEDELHRNFFNRVQAVMDAKALDESSKKSEEPVVVRLPPVRQPQATPVNGNGLRGQAADFKPFQQEQIYNPAGWQTLAQKGRMNGSGGGW